MATPIEELIEAASGDASPVSTLLRKLKVVTARLGTVRLEAWVDHELNGYPKTSELPDYRAERSSEVKGDLAGAFGSGMKNAPIPPAAYPEELRYLFTIEYRQGIAELERLAEAQDQLGSKWAADMVAYTNRLITKGEIDLYGGMYLQDAWHVISPALVRLIVDTVRTRVLDLALALEAIEPRAGELATPAVDPARLEQLVVNVYGGNVAVASTEVRQQAVVVAAGDRVQLLEALRAAGLDDAAILELEHAIDEDEKSGDGSPSKRIGPRVKGWIADAALKAPAAAGKGAAGAVGGIAVKAIAGYYGIG